MPLQVLLTHPGTQYSYALAQQLHRLQILQCFATGIAFGDNKTPMLPSKWKRRVVPGVPDEMIHRQWMTEMQWLWQKKFKGGNEATLLLRNEKFQENIPLPLMQQADAIIGFDTSSWILIQRAHQAHKKLVLDASIAHPIEKEKVYEQLRRQYPAWQQNLIPKSDKQIDLELQEMKTSNHIVAATSFTRNSYIAQGVDAHKISINPYGIHLDYFTSKWDNQQTSAPRKEIVFAFLGIISARKGIPWLCQIWQAFHSRYPHTKLLLGGYGNFPDGVEIPKGIDVIGFIEPHQRNAWLQQADVFVFPSFFEGFAQVIIEAMGCGLPVITTTSTVGPEVIDEGVEGFVMTPGDDQALLNALTFFAQQPEAIETMGRAAREKVLPFTWNAYGDRYRGILEQVVKHG
ncbi:MAG TPA: glycosyltransferase family 4 protein [Phnomibacter sp.]|nr:glycosyltransferase family 4 protein [Phnomibacter sp.]